VLRERRLFQGICRTRQMNHDCDVVWTILPACCRRGCDRCLGGPVRHHALPCWADPL
jgi:hypothetical protein